MDVRGARTTVGAKTIIYAKNSSFRANQVWKITPQPDGAVALQSVLHPYRYLYIDPITQNAVISTNKTNWYFDYNFNSDCYRVFSKNNAGLSFYLGVKNDATTADSEVIANISGATASKKWDVLRINNYVPVTGVSISSPSTVSTFTETLKGDDGKNTTINFSAVITPSTATNRAVTWSSSDTTVATIDEKTGEAKLISPGAVTFYATANDDRVIYDTCRVNVISNFTYIKNYGDGRYFDIANSGIADGTKLLHWSFHGASNQIMKIVKRSFNTFSIHPLPSMNAKAVTVSGEAVSLQEYEGGNNQLFQIVSPAGPYDQLRIVSKATTHCLTEDDSNNKYIISKELAAYAEQIKQTWTFESYESKAMSMVNFAAYSLSPGNNYQFLAYNTFISNMSTFALNELPYKQGASWKVDLPVSTYGAYTSKNDLLSLMPYSDVVFIDSHGSHEGTYLYYETEQQNQIYHTDICKGFIQGSDTITDSIFKEKTKWVITNGCYQLEHIDGAENSPAIRWARAMLGDGNRLHGVLGYYGSAPEDPPYNRVLTKFFDYLDTDNMTVINAWKEAGTYYYDTNWAVIYHVGAYGDKFNSMTSITPSETPVVIERMYLNNETPTPLDLDASFRNPSVSAHQSINIDALIMACVNSGVEEIYLDKDNTAKITVDREGNVFFKDLKNVLDRESSVSLSQKEAAQNSMYALYEMGVIDTLNYSAKIQDIKKHTLDLENNTAINEVVLGYQITLIPKTNANKISEKNVQDNTIRLIYTNNTISSFMRYGTMKEE